MGVALEAPRRGGMRAGNRLVGALFAGIVWVYAGMSFASRPVAQQAITPSLLDAAATSALVTVD
jgi:hypothetical protein